MVFVHLFPNGNGRHARLWANWVLRRAGEPPVDWGGGFGGAGETRRRYMAALRAADGGTTGSSSNCSARRRARVAGTIPIATPSYGSGPKRRSETDARFSPPFSSGQPSINRNATRWATSNGRTGLRPPWHPGHRGAATPSGISTHMKSCRQRRRTQTSAMSSSGRLCGPPPSGGAGNQGGPTTNLACPMNSPLPPRRTSSQ